MKVLARIFNHDGVRPATLLLDLRLPVGQVNAPATPALLPSMAVDGSSKKAPLAGRLPFHETLLRSFHLNIPQVIRMWAADFIEFHGSRVRFVSTVKRRYKVAHRLIIFGLF